jgi:hypothetical protein
MDRDLGRIESAAAHDLAMAATSQHRDAATMSFPIAVRLFRAAKA